jgi:hypothetical protein
MMAITIYKKHVAALHIWTLLGLAVLAPRLAAQTVVAPVSQVSSQPEASQDFFGTQPSAASLDSAFAALALEPPLQFGQTTFLPHLLYRYVYGTGIQAILGHPSSTSINTVSPGLLVNYGKQWALDYSPSWSYYSNSEFHDTTGQTASLNGLGQFGEWTYTLSGTYIAETEPLVETGMQTSEKDYTGGVHATRQLGAKVLLDFNLNEGMRFAVGFPNTKDTSTLDWVDYQITRGFEVGVGGSVGYVSVSQGADTLYVSPQGHLTFRATEKITLTLSGGVQRSEFVGSSSSALDSPIYDIAIQYQPFETTKLIIDSGQSITNSYFENQATRTLQFSGKLEQRLLGHYYLSVGLEEDDTDYFSSSENLSHVRGDRESTVDVRLSTILFGRGSVAVFFNRTKNASNVAGYGFSSGQLGFEIGYRF